MRLRYRLLNVFARPGELFSGNPLAVVEDATALSDGQMQALARQFNLSETTFLVAPEDGAAAGVRIFTASHEMTFAGHPTLGTAHVARSLGLGGDRLGLSMPAGVIPVAADGDTWTLTANRGVVEAELDPDELAAALGLEAGDVLPGAAQVSVGTSQVIAPVRSPEAVRRVRVVPPRVEAYAGMGRDGGEVLVYAWAPQEEGVLSARAVISDGSSVSEDAATGSACSNLGAWFAAHGRTGRWEVRQGEHVHRPSTLCLDVGADGTVEVGGLVREVGGGEVEA